MTPRESLQLFATRVGVPLHGDPEGNVSTRPQWESSYRQAHGLWPARDTDRIPPAPLIAEFWSPSGGPLFLASCGAPAGDLFVQLAQHDCVTWWRLLLRLLAQATPEVELFTIPEGLGGNIEASLAISPNKEGGWRRVLLLTTAELQAARRDVRTLEQVARDAPVADLRRVCTADQLADRRNETERRRGLMQRRLETLKNNEAPRWAIENEEENLFRATAYLASL